MKNNSFKTKNKMVSYYLNKCLRVEDLKEKGYKITDNRNDKKLFPIGIDKDGFAGWLAIDGYHTEINDNIDDTVFYRLEGSGFIGGIDLMLEIAEDFDLKFMNDEEFELLYFYEKHDFEKEDEGKERWNEDLSWIQITRCEAYPQYEGLRINEIAKIHGTDVYDAMYDMIVDSKNACNACYFTMCEEDVKTVIAHPRAMICTDSGVAGVNKVFHPRLKATFPRVIGKYVREEKVVSLHEMIRKITAMPAMVYGLDNKGLIKVGLDADICIFDSEKIIDESLYTDCQKKAKGLNYVILNGEVVVEDAVFNGKRNGRVILK